MHICVAMWTFSATVRLFHPLPSDAFMRRCMFPVDALHTLRQPNSRTATFGRLRVAPSSTNCSHAKQQVGYPGIISQPLCSNCSSWLCLKPSLYVRAWPRPLCAAASVGAALQHAATARTCKAAPCAGPVRGEGEAAAAAAAGAAKPRRGSGRVAGGRPARGAGRHREIETGSQRPPSRPRRAPALRLSCPYRCMCIYALGRRGGAQRHGLGWCTIPTHPLHGQPQPHMWCHACINLPEDTSVVVVNGDGQDVLRRIVSVSGFLPSPVPATAEAKAEAHRRVYARPHARAVHHPRRRALCVRGWWAPVSHACCWAPPCTCSGMPAGDARC